MRLNTNIFTAADCLDGSIIEGSIVRGKVVDLVVLLDTGREVCIRSSLTS